MLLLSAVPVVAVVLMTYGLHKRSCYMQDSRWLEVGRNAGFLNSPDIALDSYAEAIEILRQHGIDAEFFETRRTGKQYPTVPKDASDEFVRLIIKGAKAKRLGIKINRPKPFTTEIYTSDNRRFQFDNFRLLPKAIAHFAKIELIKTGDMDKATLLGNANLALGTQLSAYNVDFIHMCGIACKALGLQTLEECAKAQNDEKLLDLVHGMRQDLDKEFELVKSMPPTLPSFWDFFSQCMKTEADVNENSPTDFNSIHHLIERKQDDKEQ